MLVDSILAGHRSQGVHTVYTNEIDQSELPPAGVVLFIE
jgi:hypothetical protein